jgi:ribose-phosphate pyrophosphokinase
LGGFLTICPFVSTEIRRNKMARLTAQNVETIPYGPLGIIAMPGCEAFADKVDQYLVQWRKNQALEHQGSIAFYGYQRETYKINISNPRFGSGESKAVINETVRGYDLYIVTDCFNYSVTYKMYGMTVPKSPDDHYADLKRVISAASSKAKRISVIMPMLYEGRQHKRSSRESLDCAMALQELVNLGVENIITFDAHDQRVQNAIPHKSFENVMPTYQMIKAIVNNIDDLKVDKDHLMVISPDEGAMQRCIYFATQLGVNLGMFYKRRDFTKVVDGRNPIVEHQYLGDPINGKDIIIVDDMISSGESMLEVAKKLKGLGANRIFVCTTFGLFANGLDVFDEAYKEGVFEKVFTTNGVYQTPELLSREWYQSVDLSKYVAYFLDTLNHDMSVSSLLDSSDKIDSILRRKGLK